MATSIADFISFAMDFFLTFHVTVMASFILLPAQVSLHYTSYFYHKLLTTYFISLHVHFLIQPYIISVYFSIAADLISFHSMDTSIADFISLLRTSQSSFHLLVLVEILIKLLLQMQFMCCLLQLLMPFYLHLSYSLYL